MSATSHIVQMLDKNMVLKDVQVEKGIFLTSTSDNTWQLREGGSVLPPPNSQWAEIYAGKPWATFDGLVLSTDRTSYITRDGKCVMKSTIRRLGAPWGKETPWLEKMFTFPNSQVKNFLNACRGTYGKVADTLRVAIVGSKSREGSGLWHKLYATYALSLANQVFIDFYDPAEVEEYWEYSTNQGVVTCAWIPELFDVREMSDYDVVIDDAWLQGSSSLGFSIPFGSQKGVPSGVPFLHPTERRLFTSKVSSYVSPCPCSLCVEISKCVDSYVQYQVLRMYCSRLGHYTACDSAFYTKDLNVVAGFLREISTHSVVDLRTKTMIRGLLSVCEEIPLDVDKGIVRHGKGSPQFEAFSRYQIDTPNTAREVYRHLKGKKVAFIGVRPHVLGDTPTQALWNSACHLETGVEFVFVNSNRLWSQILSTPFSPSYVYVPEHISGESHPDWQETSIFPAIPGFKCWTKKDDQPEPVFQPCQILNGVVHQPTSLYPILDVSVLGRVIRPASEQVVKTVLTWFTIEDGVICRRDDPTYQSLEGLIALGFNGEWAVCNDPRTPSGSIRVGSYSMGFFSPMPPIDVTYLEKIGKRVTEKEYGAARDAHGDMFEVSLTSICKVRPKKRPGKKDVPYNEGTLTFRFKNVPVPLCFLPYLEALSVSPFYQLMQDFDKWDSVKSEWDKLWRIHGDTYIDLNHKGRGAIIVIHPHEKGVAHKDDVGETIVEQLLTIKTVHAPHRSVRPQPSKDPSKKGPKKKK